MDRAQSLRFFQHLDRERFLHLQELAPANHRLVYQLLPLLFHVNHDSLPGFVSDTTPIGLADYTPDQTSLDKARQLDKRFHYQHRALHYYPLYGLYLVYSQSWLSYPQQPAPSLWLIHSDKLSAEQRSQLEQKLLKVIAWAKTEGIRFSYRLLTKSELGQQSLSVFERDAFYTSGMVLAGAVPYWWLLTTEEHQHYPENLTQLQSQHLPNTVSFANFGEANHYSVIDIATANIQAMSFLLESGHGLLDVLFWFHHLNNTDAPSLSSLLKQQHHLQSDKPFLEWDKQALQLAFLSETLNPSTLKLARESLYHYAQEPLSLVDKQAVLPWRRQTLVALTEQWGWSERQISQLDHQQRDFSSLMIAFSSLEPLCIQILTGLQRYIDSHHLPLNLVPLRKRLQLRFAAQSDAIQSLPIPSRPQLNGERLFLHRFSQKNRWYLHSQALSAPTNTVLLQHDNLLHLLATAIHNRLIGSSNGLNVSDQQQQMSTTDIMDLIQQLLSTSLAGDDLTHDDKTVCQPKGMTQLFIGINLLQTPNDKQLRQASQLSSKQNDPLNYSSFHISLVTSLDLLYRSTVGSWHSVHFSGTTSPIEMLQNLLNWQPSFLPANSLRCWCSTAMFSQSINRRIEQLIQQLIAHYHSSGKAGRFLLAVANTLYSLQWQQGYPVEYIALPYHSIWQILAENGPFRQQQVDKQLDKSGLIARLLMMHRPGQLNLVLLDNSPGQICYVIDEAGRLFRQDYPSLSQSQLIARLQPFIQQLPKKHIATHFYHLSQQHERWFIRQLIPPEASRQYLPVQVRLDSLSDAAYVDIQYGQQRFVGHLNDSALTNRIQQLNQQLRQRQPTIVITINSLLFTNMAEASTGLYLQSKYQLEKLLQLLI